MRASRTLRFTAIHEAAHAVYAYRLRVPFRRVTIVPGEGYIGQLLHSRRAKLNIQSRVDICFAGPLAARQAGDPDWRRGGDQDYQDASEFAAMECSSPASAVLFLEWRQQEVLDEITEGERMIDVLTLTEVLLAKRTMTHAEVRAAIDPNYAENQQWLRDFREKRRAARAKPAA